MKIASLQPPLIVMKKMTQDRLTVSLGPGQRDALETIAARSQVKLAFAVRFALSEFIDKYEDRQLPLFEAKIKA